MKNCLIAVLMFSISLNAYADSPNPRPTFNTRDDWFKVKSDDKGTSYAHLPTLIKEGDVVNVWVLSDYQKPLKLPKIGMGYSMELKYELNCKEMQLQILAITLYGLHPL